MSGLITKPGGEWAGGATVAVQIGDILDRGVGEVGIFVSLGVHCVHVEMEMHATDCSKVGEVGILGYCVPSGGGKAHTR